MDAFKTVMYSPYRKGQIFDQLITTVGKFEDIVTVLKYPISETMIENLVVRFLLSENKLSKHEDLSERESELLEAIKIALETGKMFCSPTEAKNIKEQLERFTPLKKEFKATKNKEVIYQQIIL